ncbi:MAG: pitrilysin family protein [Longimicrobiales bacterium]
MSESYRRTELGDGLSVLTESMPGVLSASIGVWVRAGSVTETPGDMGVSHMLEHMVFKGTENRTAHELALVLERLGGSLDAYTTREHTSYQARVLDAHVDIALDVLADLVLRPTIREADLELEREVILEEISTVDDTPDDLVFDLHAEALFGGHPFGYSILGTRETVTALSSDDLRRVHGRHYRAGNLVVAAAGRVDHDAFVEQVRIQFGEGRAEDRVPEMAAPALLPVTDTHVERPTAQTHVAFGAPTFGHSDPRRYALILLSSAFGGGMSSRLFQRVREELGLAYAVYSYQSFQRTAGMAGVYVGTRPEWGERAVDVVREEMSKLARDGLTAAELEDAKGQVKGQVAISLESSSARLHRLAGSALYDEAYRSLEEVVSRVDAVSGAEVAELAAEYYDPSRQTVLRLGPAKTSLSRDDQ